MATGYLTLFDSSGNGLGMASAATSVTTENRSLTVGSGTLTAATGTFTNVGGTLTTVSQPNVTTLGGVTSLNSITVGSGTLSGLSSVSSTAFVGTLSTVSQPNVTTLGGVTSIASLITISGSQVGIGTSPSYLLHVSGTSTGSIASAVQNLSTGTSAQARFQLLNDRNSAAASQGFLSIYSSTNTVSLAGLTLADMVLLDASGTNNQGLLLATESAKPIYFATNSALRARFDSSGNFGINVAPSARLHVNETSGGAVAIIGSSDGGANDDKLQFRSAYSSLANSSDITGQILGAPSNTGGRLVFSTSASTTGTLTSRVLIDDAGFVAVGNTLSPSYQFHVQSAALGSTSTNTSVMARFQSAAVGNGVYLDILKYRNGAGSDHTTEEIMIRRTTDVTPQSFLVLASGYAKLSGNGGTAIYVNSSEYVGIQNANPARYLDIGNVALNGGNAYEVALGRSDASSTIRVGQAATTSMFFGWTYNGTPASAYGTIGTYGGSNNICLQESGGNIGITTTTSLNNKLEVEGGVRVRGDISTTGSGAGVEISYASNTGTIGPHNRALGTTQKDLVITSAALTLNIHNSSTYQIIGSTSGLYPTTDNSISCGKTGNRWTAVWAANGTIQTSDEVTKENITATPLGLEFINKLEPCSFKFKDTSVKVWDGKSVQKEDGTFKDEKVERILEQKHKRRHHGLVAQQVLQVLDDLKISTDDFAGYIDPKVGGEEGPIGLRYDQFIAPLIKAVQELNAHVESLNIKELLERVQRIEDRLALLP